LLHLSPKRLRDRILRFLHLPSLPSPLLTLLLLSGFRTLSESGARFHIYQQRRLSFSDLPRSGSLNSTPNSANKLSQYRPLSTTSTGIPPTSAESSTSTSRYYDHKYSEPMRHLDFQYVNEEVSQPALLCPALLCCPLLLILTGTIADSTFILKHPWQCEYEHRPLQRRWRKARAIFFFLFFSQHQFDQRLQYSLSESPCSSDPDDGL
jgi:hypothetical protein